MLLGNAFLERANLELPNSVVLSNGQSTQATEIGFVASYPNHLRTHLVAANTLLGVQVTANPFIPKTTDAPRAVLRSIDYIPPNITLTFPVVVSSPFIPSDLSAKVTAFATIFNQQTNYTAVIPASTANPFRSSTTEPKTPAFVPVVTPPQNFTSVIPASSFNPFVPKATDARSIAAKPVDFLAPNLTLSLSLTVTAPFIPNVQSASVAAVRAVESQLPNPVLPLAKPFVPYRWLMISPASVVQISTVSNLLTTTLAFVQPSPFTPTLDLARNTASVPISNQALNTLALGSTPAPVPFTPSTTTAPVTGTYALAAAMRPLNLLESTLTPVATGSLPFAFMAWTLTPRPSQPQTFVDRGLNLPLSVPPVVVASTQGGGGDSRKILAERKRLRLIAEAKAARDAKAKDERLAQIMAGYADDPFLPFPLHDVLAQQQANDDDMIMALLLSI